MCSRIKNLLIYFFVVIMVATSTVAILSVSFSNNAKKIEKDVKPTSVSNYDNKLVVFDLNNFVATLPSTNEKYDYLKVAFTLQGLINRDKPILYYIWEGNGFSYLGYNMDDVWLSDLRKTGGSFDGYTTETLTSFYQVIDLANTLGVVDGVVLWDDQVPATSNVASTIAGVENLVPIRYDPSLFSCYTDLVVNRNSFGIVKRNLNNKFRNISYLPDANLNAQTSGTASSGSSKNDAYLWAKKYYLDTNKTNSKIMGYVRDAWTPKCTTGACFVEATLPDNMTPGEERQISVTVMNNNINSGEVWTRSGNYRVASASSNGGHNDFTVTAADYGFEQGSSAYGVRLYFEDSNPVDVGERVKLTFTIKAPSTAGTYYLNLGVVHDGYGWFNGTINQKITVTSSSSSNTKHEYYGSVSGTLFHAGLNNSDYLIQKKAFFFDLSPDATSYPIDDRSQTLGKDTATFKALLAQQRSNNNNGLFTVVGFVPWFVKYTSFADSSAKLTAVQAEWKMIDIISGYHGETDADAMSPVGLTNASIFTHAPLKEPFTQNNDKEAIMSGSVIKEKYDSSTQYWVLYMGDYDCGAWTSGVLPTRFLQEYGTTDKYPLAWPIDTDLAARVPHAFNWLYEQQKRNDYFVAGDNGSGYLNPMYTPNLTDWKTHNITMNNKFDIDITGFLIAGNAGNVSNAVKNAYAEMSPTLVGYQASGSTSNTTVGNTPFISAVNADAARGSSTLSLGQDIYNNLNATSNKFVIVRTVQYSRASAYNAIDEVYSLAASAGKKIKLVDPYTFAYLYKNHPTSYKGCYSNGTDYTWVNGSTIPSGYSYVSTVSSSSDCHIPKTKLTKPTLSTSSYTYNGSAKTPTISNYDSSTMTVTGTQSATAAGNYTITIALKNSSQYEWADGTTANVVLNWSIQKATPTLTVASSKTVTYPTAETIDYTYDGDGTVSCESMSTENVTCSVNTSTKKLTLTPVKPASSAVTVKLKAAAGTNYNAASDKSISVTVEKGTLTVTKTTYSGEYDGSNHYAKIKVTKSDWDGATIVSGPTTSYGNTVTTSGQYNVDYNLKPGYSSFTNGAKTIYYKVTGGTYYNDLTGSESVTVTKRDITVTAGNASRDWNGSPLTNGDCTAGTGQLLEGHTISCTMTSSSTITEAGSVANTINTVTIKDDDDNDVTSNYNVTKVAGTLTINEVTPTVSLTAKSATYTGSPIEANEASVVPDAGGTITYTYYSNKTCSGTGTTTAPTNVGEYSVKATAAAVTGKTNTASSACVTHTITGGTATLTCNNQEYDGTEKTGCTCTGGTIGGDYKATNYSSTGYTATCTPSGSSTPLEETWYITKKNVTVTAGSSSRDWNGTALTNGDCTATGLVSGHTVSCAMTSGSTITTAGSVANTINTVTIKSGNTSVLNNYNVTTVAGTLTVNVAAPTVSLTAKTTAQRTYTGSAIEANTATVTPNSNPNITYTYYTDSSCSNNATPTAPTSVGTYYVKAHADAVTGKTSAADSSCINHSIVQASTTTSLSNISIDYTGVAQEVNNASAKLSSNDQTISGAQFTYTYYNGESCSGTSLSSVPVNAGSYSVKAVLTGTTNYATSNKCVKYTINQSSTTTTLANITNTYDETHQEADGASAKLNSNNQTISGAQFTYKYYTNSTCTQGETTTAPMNAGTYYVKAILTGTSNYESSSKCSKYTMNKATPTFTVEENTKDLTYGTNGTVSYTYDGDGTVSCESMNTEYVTCSVDTGSKILTITPVKPTNNSVVVKLKAAAGDNYVAATDKQVSVTIPKGTLTATATAYSGEYDGNTHYAKIKVTKSDWDGAIITSGTNTDYGTSVTSSGEYNVSYNLKPGYTDSINGSKTIYYKVTGGTYYNDLEGSTTVTISKKDVTVTAGSESRPWNGQPLTNSTCTAGVGQLMVGHTVSCTMTGSSTITDAGSVANTISAVTIKDSNDVNVTSSYNIGTENGLLSISEATPTLSYEAKTEAERTYTGSPIEANTAIVTPDSNPTITYRYYSNNNCSGVGSTTPPTNVGTYSVKVTADAVTNKTIMVVGQCVDHSIIKSGTTTTLANITNTYDKTHQEADGASAKLNSNNQTISGAQFTYKYYTNSTCTQGETTTAPMNAGTYYVKAILTGTSNYESSSKCSKYTMNKATPTFTVEENTKDLTYGTNGTVSYTYDGDGTVSCESMNTEYVTCSVDTGSKILTITPVKPTNNSVVVKLKAAAGDNYVAATDKQVSVTIPKGTLTATATAYSGEYDGNTHYAKIKVTKSDWDGAIITSGTNTDYGTSVTSSGEYNVSYNLKPGYTDSINGSKTIYYKVTGGTYYNDLEGSTTVTISKKDVTVTAGSESRPWNGQPLTNSTCTANGLVEGHTVSCTMTESSTITTAGYVANTISTVTIRDSNNNNVTNSYNIDTLTGTLAITKVTPTVSLSTKIAAYTGNPVVANTATATPDAGGAITYTYYSNKTCSGTGTTTAPTNVGEYSVKANVSGVTGKTNDAESSCVAHTITSAQATLTCSDQAYDGTEKVACTCTGGTIGGDYKATNYSSTGYTATCIPEGSTTQLEETWFITKKPVTITAGSSDRAWNGEVLTNNTCAAGTGQLVNGHSATCTMTSSSTITDVGSINNTINTYAIKDSSNNDVTSNYNVTTAAGTLTVNVATPIVSLSAKTEAERTYTGSAIVANTATVSPNSNPTITYTYYPTSDCSGTALSGAPTEVGTYYAKAHADAVTNKTTAADSNCVGHSIVKSSTTTSLSDITNTYDGTNQEASGASAKLNSSNKIIDGAVFTYKYYTNNSCTQGETTTAPKNAGTYYVKAILTGTDNYLTSNTCSKYTMDKTTPTLVVSSSDSLIYPTAQTIDYTYNGDGTVSCESMDTEYVTCSVNTNTKKLTITPVKPTSSAVTVKLKATAGDNYSKADDQTVSVTVAKGTLTANATAYSGEYDGNIHYAKIEVTKSDWDGATIVSGTSTDYGTNVTSSGEYNTDYNLKPGYTNFTNGTKTIYYKVTGGTYYNDLIGSTTVAISKKDVTVTAGSSSRDWNGSPLTNSSCTATGLVSGHSVTCTMTSGSTITDAGSIANTISAVTIKDFNNNDVTNSYNVNTLTGTLTITEVTPTVSLSPKTASYTGNAIEANEASAIPDAGGVKTYTYYTDSSCTTPTSSGDTTGATSEGTAPKNVGTWYVKAKVSGVTNKTNDAYSQCTAHTITAVEATLTCSDQAYDGTEKVACTCTGGTLSGDYKATNYSSTGYTATCIPDDNHKTLLEETWYINKKDLTVTAGSSSREWNGEALTNNTCTANSLVSGHTVNCIMTSSSIITDAGSISNTINTYTIKDNSNNDVTENYNVTTEAGTLTVSVVEPSISLSAKSASQRTYTGSAIEANTATVSPNSNPTITYTYYPNSDCSGTGSTTAPTNVGTYSVKAYATAVANKTTAAESSCVNHSIVQKDPTLTVAGTKELTYPNAGILDYTYDGDGEVSCESMDTEYVTCSVDTNTKKLTLTPLKLTDSAVVVKLKATEGTNYSAADDQTISVTVVEAGTDYTINNYEVDEINSYINKIMVNTELSDYTSNITLGYGYGVDVDTKTVNNKEVLYTGGKTRITKNSDLYREYTNVVVGDVNGDAQINSADLLRIRQHLLGTNVLKNEYFISSDVNYDKSVNSADLLRVRQHLLGTKPIK